MKKKLGLAISGLWLAAPLVLAQAAAPPEPLLAAPSTLAEAKAVQEAAPSSLLDSALSISCW